VRRYRWFKAEGYTVNTRAAVHSAKQGFTLIEVLIALVILAIGILGLEALGIYAIRAVAQADRNSRSAAVATLYLEDALQQFREGKVPRPCANRKTGVTGDPNGDMVTRVIRPGLPSEVVVTVTPASRGKLEQPYSLRGYTYTLTVPSGEANASDPCR
jgi:prepilin-type N-terminal cleavage/methylation domain-containing protein